MCLIAAVGEVYFRLTTPFTTSAFPFLFVPDLGYVLQPNAEMRHTNRLDFWNRSRVNSLGFLDREPPAPEDAAASCHISLVGDSFVAAREVSISDKLHIRLEELANSELPTLKVTTSAFAISDTGPVQQLPLYDKYVRPLRPKLVVLSFSTNDFVNSSPILEALRHGWDPEHLPYSSVHRLADGKLALRPPDPNHLKFRMPWPTRAAETLASRVTKKAVEVSWLANWLDAKIGSSARFSTQTRSGQDPLLAWRTKLLNRDPRYAALLAGWQPAMKRDIARMLRQDSLPPVFEEALDYAAFALRQWKESTARDGAKLAILALHRMKVNGSRPFELMSEMAHAIQIPVIDQADHILRQGALLEDANFRHDAHWNPAGHQFAAQALLEHLMHNQRICQPSLE